MATFEFRLPDIGEGIVEGEIVKWLVREGDLVDEDQPMVEVMTDKATVAIPSPRRGRVLKLHGREGEIAKVHGVLVTLEVTGEDAPLAATVSPTQAAPTQASPTLSASRSGNGRAEAGGRVLATPVTRRMAREHGIDLASVAGSGPGGRVLKADLLRAVSGGASAVSIGAPGGIAVPAETLAIAPAPVRSEPEDQRIPLKGLRRAIARKMVTSVRSAAHFTFAEEMDATELKALRARLNAAMAGQGEPTKFSYLPFVVKALVAAMKKFPHVNAVFDEAAQELVVRSRVNVGIAVATPEGLVVPVVHDAQSRSLKEIGGEIARLAAAARERKLRPEDLAQGTFSITSLGEQGGLFATPIINYPEVAILGVHRMRPRPVVKDDRIVVRDMMVLSLSFDHRVIDGAVGAAFTYEVIRLLERPELLMLELG